MTTHVTALHDTSVRSAFANKHATSEQILIVYTTVHHKLGFANHAGNSPTVFSLIKKEEEKHTHDKFVQASPAKKKKKFKPYINLNEYGTVS